MSTVDADVLIVGAGCAGLSLAAELVERGVRDVVLVEPRTEFGRDRTWCFFDVVPHRWDACVTKRWARWEVRSGGRSVVRASDGVRYCHLPSERFYEAALGAIAGHAEVLRGRRIVSLVDEGARVVARTESGDELRARRAFDSRPPTLDADGGHVTLLQHFVGHVVETDAPVFDAGTATLMDFDVTQEHGVHFVYVLPEDARHALVESTFFSPAPVEAAVYEAAIADALHARGLREWRVTHTERGVIPMTTRSFPQRPSPRVYRIGVAGGMAKPSTGYAFLAIQRFSAELARRLAREELPDPPSPRARRSEVLDTVFLDFLARHPEAAPAVFTHLFERADPAALVRFLSDAGSPADDLRIIAAVRDPRLAVAMARTRRLWQPQLLRR